jgi:hypothetical protein
MLLNLECPTEAILHDSGDGNRGLFSVVLDYLTANQRINREYA